MTAQIGHNRQDHVAAARIEMNELLEPFKKRRDEFLASAAKAVVRDRHEAGDATDLIGMAKEVWGTIEEKRKSISDPHFAAHRAAIEVAVDFWEPVVEAMDAVMARIENYKAERKRLMDQQEAEQRAAMAPPPPPAADGQTPRQAMDYTAPVQQPSSASTARKPKAQPIKGSYGHKLVETTDTVVEITDWKLIPDYIMEAQAVQDAIAQAVKGFVKLTKKSSIPGANITLAGKSSVRS